MRNKNIKAYQIKIRRCENGEEIPIRIYANTTTLIQTLCKKSYPFDYGGCIPSVFKCTAECDVDLTGEKVFVSLATGNVGTSEIIALIGTVKKCKLNDDRKSRSFEIYDELEELLNIDITDYYNNECFGSHEYLGMSSVLYNISKHVGIKISNEDNEFGKFRAWGYEYKDDITSYIEDVRVYKPKKEIKNITFGKFLRWAACVGGAFALIPVFRSTYNVVDIDKNTFPISGCIDFIDITCSCYEIIEISKASNVDEYDIEGFMAQGVSTVLSDNSTEYIIDDSTNNWFYDDRNVIYELDNTFFNDDFEGRMWAERTVRNMYNRTCGRRLQKVEHLKYRPGTYTFPYGYCYGKDEDYYHEYPLYLPRIAEYFRTTLYSDEEIIIFPCELKYSGSCLSNLEITCYGKETYYSSSSDINSKSKPASSKNDGLMSASDKMKLINIEAGAQVNKIEEITLNGSAVSIENKKVNINALPASEKGSAGGIAELDENGKILSSQLPSYVDDVQEYSSKSAFPPIGESGKIYVDVETNLTYRWTGNDYTEISPSLALGENASTAYRGDRGKLAYDHISDTVKHITSVERTSWNNKVSYSTLEDNTAYMCNLSREHIINDNDDLDDYTEAGTYACPSSAVAKTLAHCPFTTRNFRLFVIRNTETSSSSENDPAHRFYGAQLLISGQYIYARYHDGQGIRYESWKRILHTSDITSVVNATYTSPVSSKGVYDACLAVKTGQIKVTSGKCNGSVLWFRQSGNVLSIKMYWVFTNLTNEWVTIGTLPSNLTKPALAYYMTNVIATGIGYKFVIQTNGSILVRALGSTGIASSSCDDTLTIVV